MPAKLELCWLLCQWWRCMGPRPLVCQCLYWL